MVSRHGRSTFTLNNRPSIISRGSVVGKTEGEGPLKDFFDKIYYDSTAGQETWEKSESYFQQQAFLEALERGQLHPQDIDVMFSGDLLNQCISSSFGLREFNVPYLGQYGACSTMAQTLLLSSIFVNCGIADIAAAVTASHFCSAERQFRFPLEYGGQRTPTAQRTVTGGGCAIVGKNAPGKPYVNAIHIGTMVDLGIKDANNMGAAMAPAAAKSISEFLLDTETKPSDYDLILTGDLGEVGSSLLCELMLKDGLDISANHNDCGLLIFDREGQDVHAGGSGCGCAASVFCSCILNSIENGKLKNVILAATGALMSPTSSQQGESIPGISHIVNIKMN